MMPIRWRDISFDNLNPSNSPDVGLIRWPERWLIKRLGFVGFGDEVSGFWFRVLGLGFKDVPAGVSRIHTSMGAGAPEGKCSPGSVVRIPRTLELETSKSQTLNLKLWHSQIS